MNRSRLSPPNPDALASIASAPPSLLQQVRDLLDSRSLGRVCTQRVTSRRIRAQGRCRIPIPEALRARPDLLQPGVSLPCRASSPDGGGRVVATVGPALHDGPHWLVVDGDFGPCGTSSGLWSDVYADVDEPAPPFALHPNLAAGIGRLDVELTASRARSLQPTRFVSLGWKPLYTEALRFGAVLRGRHSDGFWFRLHVEGRPGEPCLRFRLRAGLSDDTKPNQLLEADARVSLVVRGASCIIDYAANLGLHGLPLADGKGVEFELLRGELIADAQAPCITGRFLFLDHDLGAVGDYVDPLPEIIGGLWRVSGMFPPLGAIPDVVDSYRWTGDQFGLLPLHAGIWAHAPHMLAERPGVSGDQADFGVQQLLPMALYGSPLGLAAVRLSILQEGARPEFPVEADTSPVTAAHHPNWWTWKHYTHYHPSYGLDRLGKVAGAIIRPTSQTGTAWDGEDPDHESVLYRAAFLALTDCPIAREVLDAWLESGFAQYTVRSGTYLDGIGNPRAYGRSQLALLMAFLATGRRDALERARERFLVCFMEQAVSAAQLAPPLPATIPMEGEPAAPPPPRRAVPAPIALRELEPADAFGPTWREERWATLSAIPDLAPLQAGRPPGYGDVLAARGVLLEQGAIMSGFDPAPEATGELFVTSLFEADPRAVPEVSWSTWQEAFACQAHGLLWLLTGLPQAREAARRSARTIIMHGLHERPDGTWAHGGYLAWQGGQPLTAAQWADPQKANIWGDQMHRWILPAAHVAAYFAELAEAEDPDYAERLQRYLRWVDSLWTRSARDPMLPWRAFAAFGDRARAMDLAPGVGKGAGNG